MDSADLNNRPQAERASDFFRTETDRYRFLADAAIRLAGASDFQAIVNSIVHSLVPTFADWAAVYVSESGDGLHLEAAAHADSAKADLIWDMSQHFPFAEDAAMGPGKVLRSGNPEWMAKSDPSLIESLFLDSRSRPLMGNLHLSSYICFSLGQHADFQAILLLASGESERAYNEADFSMAEEFARCASQAIDSKRSFLNATARRLEEMERSFHHLADGLHAIIWESEAERSEYVYVSKRSVEILGYPAETWLAQNGLWARLIHPQDRAQVLEDYRQAVKTHSDLTLEYRMISKDGRIKWVLDIIHFRKDSSSNRVMASGIVIDVTQQHETMEALRKSEAMLALFSQQVEDYAFIMMDRDARITGWNGAAEKILGYSQEEVIGKHSSILFTNEDKNRDFPDREIMTAIADGSAGDVRWHIRKDGHRFWCVGVLTALRDEQGNLLGFVKLIRDTSDQKRREEELQRAKEAAETASEAKSQFLAMMSHELRTPLGAIIGFADALLDPELPEATRIQYAATIRNSGTGLATLIDDILDLSKVEAGRLEIERHEFRLDDLIRDVFSLLGSRAQQKQLAMRLETKGLIPETIESDPTRLRQILINVLGNAIKFTDKGEVCLTVQYLAADAGEKSRLAFTVSDTGPGIPEERRSQLFQPFVQADNSISRRFGGSGLGLVLSRRLARALGGDVDLIKSEIDRGTTFQIRIETGAQRYVTLRETIKLSSPAQDVASSLPKNKPLAGVRALVVDDAPENRLLIRHILSRAGCSRIETADDGEAALASVEKGEYDVILMDMQMPKLDGYEATATLRRQGYEKPVIALTAHAMLEERQRCLAVGCDDFLMKPINTQRLIDSVLDHTAAKRGFDSPQTEKTDNN